MFFLSRVTLKFDGWPWKIIWHLFILCQALCIIWKPLVNSNWSYSPEILNSGQNWFFYPVWLWNLTDDLDQGKSDGFDSCDRPSNLTQIGFKLSIFRPCDLEIWWMTPKNNKARRLYNIKLCVSFHIHQWIQSGVTVRKRPIWVKLDYFF